MKTNKLILTTIILTFSLLSFSQQSIVFEKTYRTVTPDTVIMAQTGAQTSDGGYLLGGYAAYGMYLSQMMFFKIDSVGNYQWKKMYGSLPCSSNMIHDMEPVGDGTFICCGEGTFSTEGEPGDLKPTNSMVMRIDEDANIIWHKEFDVDYHECLYELALSDTSFICVGYRQNVTKDPGQYLWITGNLNGSITNVNTLDLGFNQQVFNGVDQTFDGKFIAAGYAWTSSIILNIEHNGDTISSNFLTYENQEQSTAYDIICSDDEILICGSIEIEPLSSSFQAFYANVEYNFSDSNFIIFDHENEFERSYAQKIIKIEHESFILSGGIEIPSREIDLWLKKVNLENELLWKRYIGGNANETLRDVISTKDDGFLIIGESSSFDQYTSMYIVKTDSLGLGNYTSPVEEYIVNKENEFIIYPNPANNNVTIEFENSNNEYSIEIFDMSGRQVIQKNSSNYETHLNVQSLKNGLYMVRILYDNISYQNKLIINH